jgi:hypothetical protein
MKNIIRSDKSINYYRAYTNTIDRIQNNYDDGSEHWQLQIKKYYTWLLAYQLENFDRS